MPKSDPVRGLSSRVNPKQYPTPEEVLDFHMLSDVDSKKDAQHHTIGAGPLQAAPGNHTHNGNDSPFLFDPSTTIATGDLSTTAGQRTAIKAILTALKNIGMTDSTSN
jgi:hypothetical protein